MIERVFVSNLCVYGFHGVAKAEQSLGQKFYIDIDCNVVRPEPAADRMEDTVCYGALCDLVARLSAKTTFNLIESFARQVADEILVGFPLVQSVRVQIRKPSAPVRHAIDHVGVEVQKRRHD